MRLEVIIVSYAFNRDVHVVNFRDDTNPISVHGRAWIIGGAKSCRKCPDINPWHIRLAAYEDVVIAIDRVCTWYETGTPKNDATVGIHIIWRLRGTGSDPGIADGASWTCGPTEDGSRLAIAVSYTKTYVNARAPDVFFGYCIVLETVVVRMPGDPANFGRPSFITRVTSCAFSDVDLYHRARVGH
jgi:hypothetical protein